VEVADDLHPWPATAEEAMAIQDRLRPLADLTSPGPRTVRTVAGLDVAYADDRLDDGGQVVGRALRTQTGVRPVFVSVGHRAGLNTACAITLRLSPRHRLPETTRRSDRSSQRTLTGH
jgi:deoxyinosine 3'endonuclease (endonuclease V)